MGSRLPWISSLLLVILAWCIGVTGKASTGASAASASAAAAASKAVVLEACERKCAVQKQTEELTLDVGCGNQCRVEQCSRGCKAWQKALDSSCPDVCNGTHTFLAPKELYCVMGCNDAVSQYIHRIKEGIGTLKAPALVADTLGPTSLSLEWEKVPNVPGAVYLVQWRYESPSPHSGQGNGRIENEWQYCRNMSWGPETMRKIENLQPYTKYRFRIAVLLGPPSKGMAAGTQGLSGSGVVAGSEPEVMAVSEPSVVVGTLGEGPPSSPPASVRATAADPTRVSVSWESGPFPNGPVLSYVLAISETITNSTNTSLSMHQSGGVGNGWLTRNGNFHATNELPPGFSAVKDIPDSENGNTYMFQNLIPNRNYTVSVRMRNGVGEGPVALTTVSTPPEPTEKDNFQPVLILGSHHSVIRQGADMLEEPTVIYNSSHLIKGVGLHISKDLLFVSDGAGIVWRMPLGGSLPGVGTPTVTTNGNNRRGMGGGSGSITKPSTVITSTQLGSNPLDLSVDWLNDQLYILGEVITEEEVQVEERAWMIESWQIARCRLDGSGLTVAVAGFHAKPKHFEVDPYNGYLFWVLPGGWPPPWGGGLYRIDLADISNGVRHEVNPTLLMAAPDLGAFTVDHSGFRILVPDHSRNTVFSVSLDGKEKTDLRGNTQRPMFSHVVSLSWAAGLFYWTDGQEVLTEEFHPGQRAYFHNTYPALSGDQPFSRVALALPSAQPLPIPVNPPTQLQAVLGATLAKVSWQVPHLIGVQGKGAWQNWSYELQVQEESTGTIALRKDIFTPLLGPSPSLPVMSVTTSMPIITVTVHGLKPDTPYILKARAYTARGRGPWSTEFRGRTLRSSNWKSAIMTSVIDEDEESISLNTTKNEELNTSADGGDPLVLWSADAGLMASDITGDSVSMLIHKDNLKDPTPNGDSFHVQDAAWLGSDMLFLVANTTRLYWLNTTSHTWGGVGDIRYVGSVAVDWIGLRLYWSNPKQQLINRGNLNGTQQESLPILTVAKELNIDAVHAFIYWSTGHAVECSRLNGEDRRTYYHAKLFSGKQVMGLTLDVDRRETYWIVRSYEGSVLFKASMANDGHWPPLKSEIPYERVSSLQQSMVQGPLLYFSNHLLWLQGDRIAVIGDMTGQNAALVSGESLTGLHTAAVIDPALYVFPDSIEKGKVSVIPNPVPIDSIRILGTWDLFRISWSPVNNVNHGKVFYEVKMDDFTGKEIVVVVEQTWVEWPYEAKLRPYTKLAISVRPFTYWGGSSGVGSAGRARRAVLRTPQHLPSAPISPRAFISFSRDPLKGLLQQETIATFRWDPPASTNGVILSYGVDCWLENSFPVDSEKPISMLYDDTQELSRYCDGNVTDPDHHRMDPQHLEFIALNLRRNATYYFTVRAYTIVGGGQRTATIQADTGEESPVPKLLLSTVNSVVQVADIDRHKGIARQPEEDAYTIKGKGGLSGASVDVAFISHEDRIFWLSETQTIMSSRLDGTNHTKIISLNNTGMSIAVDWVGRFLYWSEMNDDNEESFGRDNNMQENWDWNDGNSRKNQGSSIRCLDLSEADIGGARPFVVLQSSKVIHKIDVSPLTSELIWVEVGKKNAGSLMKSYINGTNIQPFFKTNKIHARRHKRDGIQMRDLCTCPNDPSVGLAMTVDQSHEVNNKQWEEKSEVIDEMTNIRPHVLWVDAIVGHVYLADTEGCQCQLVVNATFNKGLPPTSVTSDGRNVYWSNSTEGKVYSIPRLSEAYDNKEESQGKQKLSDLSAHRATAMDVTGVRRIIALGPHLQPYPAPHCLSPWRKRDEVGKKPKMELLERTSHSLSLQLPIPEKPPGCGLVSLASVQYTIHYGKIYVDLLSLNDRETVTESNNNTSSRNQTCGLSLIGCNTMLTYSRKIDVTGLEPFSRYAFFVSMSNYYEQLEGVLPEVSSPEYFETSPGAPPPPRELSVTVNGPSTAEVHWLAPAQPNGHQLKYEVHWSAEASSGGARQTGAQSVSPSVHLGQGSDGSDKKFLSYTIQNLLPDQKYLIWVRAFSEDHQEYSESETISAATFPEPGNLILLTATSNTLNISWKSIQPTADPHAHTPMHTIQYTRMGMDQWENISPPSTSTMQLQSIENTEGSLSYSIDGLQPKTRYTFRLSLKYPLSKEPYIWPPDGRFTFETLGDKPGMPGKPPVVEFRRGLFQVSWELAHDNGAPILYYILEGRQIQSKVNSNPKDMNPSTMTLTSDDVLGDRIISRATLPTEWVNLHNGSENYWIIRNLVPGAQYEFRLRAANLYGLGEPSPISSEFTVPPEGSSGLIAAGRGNSGAIGASAVPAIDSGGQKKGLVLVLWYTLSAVVVLLAITLFIFICLSRKRSKEQKSIHGNNMLSHTGLLPNHIHGHPNNLHHPHSHLHSHTHSAHPQNQGIVNTIPPIPADVELATLRELPRHGNFIHARNALYSPSQLPDIPSILALQDQVPIIPGIGADILEDGEIASLPHIRRDQITLTKFLGSGAFGEVFEGVARGLSSANGEVHGETRVAVKTLRKGATVMEKGEFLKEAQLMSNFRHEHILQLLGVCLDNDPNFIIMELMESGDLLSYLRSSRPLIYTSNALTLLDLVAMCVDVARGCRYLEEMHFVHRDLAARNCLVSTLSADTLPVNGALRHRLLVKIGDFGLARDIYKSDYYRKEGEGLLPVRWMAPESLVDGVFTCQSDVWSFGVLAWEILTLGQQPYPARNNLEVLHFVRNGGRLSRPANCPDVLHTLMNQCWSYNPESRPTFKHCLQALEELQTSNTLIGTIGAVQNGHYMRQVTIPEGDPSAMHGFKEGEVQAHSHGIPKYLELLHEGEEPSLDSRINDAAESVSACGYEVPRAPRLETASMLEEPSCHPPERPNDNENQKGIRISRTFSTASTVSEEGISASRDSDGCGVSDDSHYQNMKGGESNGKDREVTSDKNSERGSWSEQDTPVSCTDELLPQNRIKGDEVEEITAESAVHDEEEGDAAADERCERGYCNVANRTPLLHSLRSIPDVTL
ncbi:proto-oncogene tyrosine-protein kinase ROS [Hetaerina americana]|uniref:proto-oncogene tyrosine-protein kinase ROS n=1 Tax=Hetaerina americana TaxID=62018 RepID=UPI003A7F3BB5